MPKHILILDSLKIINKNDYLNNNHPISITKKTLTESELKNKILHIINEEIIFLNLMK